KPGRRMRSGETSGTCSSCRTKSTATSRSGLPSMRDWTCRRRPLVTRAHTSESWTSAGSLSACSVAFPIPHSSLRAASDSLAWSSPSQGSRASRVLKERPALGFFYGGLVRRKNLVSTIAQCFAIFAVVSLVWALWGYTLALGPPLNAFIGSLDDFGLNNVGTAPNLGYSSTIPELLYFAFQLKFAAITPALIIGAFAERIRFKALLIYIVLWTTFVYVPIAHWPGTHWSPRTWALPGPRSAGCLRTG